MSSMQTINTLKPMVRGIYDLQLLRIQTALRLAANFRAKLKTHKDTPPVIPEPLDEAHIGLARTSPIEADTQADLSKEATQILNMLRTSYKTLTSGIARNRKLPAREGFIGNELISDYSELVLVDQLITLEREEATQFRQLGVLLEDVEIYHDYLADQVGIGPAMAGVLVTRFDPYKARHISSFWKFAGLDVAADGRRRSRKEEHLVEKSYKDKKGHMKTRMSITYDPWLKTKLHILGGSFVRLDSPWAEVYRGYKHRLETDPNRIKITIDAWKKLNEANTPEFMKPYWPPGRIEAAARGYMVKMFLAEFWTTWRTLEGLPVTKPYHEAILGHVHEA